MTARTWAEGDPFPKDRPPLVDNDGIAWVWVTDPDGFGDGEGYLRQQLTCQRVAGAPEGSGVVLGPMPLERWEWPEMLADHGPFREATAEEAGVMTVTYRTVPARGYGEQTREDEGGG